MMEEVSIVPFDAVRDRDQVIGLWREIFGYATAHNDPALAIERKLAVDDGLFFVARAGKVAGTVMVGYDGHRGWIYALAVAPDSRGQGIGTRLVKHAEAVLEERGCVKINLQILEENEEVVDFYRRLGFVIEPRISMGKRLLDETNDGWESGGT